MIRRRGLLGVLNHFHHLASAATVAVAALLLTDQASACHCEFGRHLCDLLSSCDVMLRGKITARMELPSSSMYSNDVVYSVEVLDLFKGEPDRQYGLEISFVAEEDYTGCAMDLEVGEEYLLDLWRYQATAPPLIDSVFPESYLKAVGMCGAMQVWRGMPAAEVDLLEDACEAFDECATKCGKYQECRYSREVMPPIYFCADVCYPSPCGEWETCSLRDEACVDAPCSPAAVCTPVSPLRFQSPRTAKRLRHSPGRGTFEDASWNGGVAIA